MGDVGDYWREHKEYQKSQEKYWIDCPNCGYINHGLNFNTKSGRCYICGYEDELLIELQKCFKCGKQTFNPKYKKCNICGNEPKRRGRG